MGTFHEIAFWDPRDKVNVADIKNRETVETEYI